MQINFLLHIMCRGPQNQRATPLHQCLTVRNGEEKMYFDIQKTMLADRLVSVG